MVSTTTARWILFQNHRNRKVAGGKHKILVHYVDVCTPNLFGVVLWNPFKWDILWFILIKTLFIFVPATKAKWILFFNHRNRKVAGGKPNILVHYVDVFAPNLFGVVLWNPFKWDILWFILIKTLFIFVPATKAKWILFCNHRNRKVVGGKHNVLVHYVDVCAPNLFGVVLCNPLSNGTSAVPKQYIFVRNILSQNIFLCPQIHFIFGAPSILIKYGGGIINYKPVTLLGN